jgi:hypothetical protein
MNALRRLLVTAALGWTAAKSLRGTAGENRFCVKINQ